MDLTFVEQIFPNDKSVCRVHSKCFAQKNIARRQYNRLKYSSSKLKITISKLNNKSKIGYYYL